LPNDLQLMDYEDPPLAHGSTHTGVGFPVESKVPDSQGLGDAAKLLNAGKKSLCSSVPAASKQPSKCSRSRTNWARVSRRRCLVRLASRRFAFRHRRRWPSRHQAVLGAYEELRHAADGRLVLSIQRVFA
jgi:hypothetical protein